MWLTSAFIISCAIASTIANKDIINDAKSGHKYVDIRSPIGQRDVAIEEFVTSHKIPDSLVKPKDDEVEDVEEGAKIRKNVVQRIQKLNNKIKQIDNVEQSLDPIYSDNVEGINLNSKRQTRVELENFSNSGVIQEGGIRKLDTVRADDDDNDDRHEAIISGVRVSSEYPTTMRPILTTPYEYSRSSYDFIPVNIIHDDRKNSWTPFNNQNFDDVGDVSLIPAGSNSRIHVKKAPNGKDYEYEYVYYYYDEEDESKASASSNNDQGVRTTPASRRGSASSNRSKYSSIERSSTVEPATNEIISKNGIRGRQLTEGEEIPEERLPINTRFPPRSRSNHNTGTTEPTRARGNRPRPNLDLVDSSSFRTHQEGPEFPQTLPKGPVRFLGVTPNESGEEKITRGRGRPHNNQETIPVSETVDDFVPSQRRRPTNVEPLVEVEFNHGKPGRIINDNDEYETSSINSLRQDKISSNGDDKYHFESTSESITTIETPTTEYSSAMDKVALDLYAFLQQGQSNSVDVATDADDSSESTTQTDDDNDDDFNTDLPITTTENSSPTTIDTVTTTEPTTTTSTTSTTTTTTTTTTTEAPTTTSALIGRGKFRRPGVPGGSGSRNRFKSNGSTTTTTEVIPVEPTHKSRTRYGGSSNGGFKRPRPGAKFPIHEEEIQKDNSSNVNVEKPVNGRNRFRGTGARTPPSTSTTSSPIISSVNSTNASQSRPTFNKLNINRRRGRPTTAAPAASEETHEQQSDSSQSSVDVNQETITTTTKSPLRQRLPVGGARPIRPVARVNIRRPGQTTTTTTSTAAPESSVSEENSPEEPAGEGTEEETHEAPAETTVSARSTTANPLNRLRSRNRLQVQLKTTTRSPVSTTQRRSPLLPRRRTTEAAPLNADSSHEELIAITEINESSAEIDITEATFIETSTAASTKHEETRSLSSLLSPRRRLSPRRPGQIHYHEN